MSDTRSGASFGHGEVIDAVSGYLGSELESFQQSVEDFQDSSQEWRRLVSELLGTFFLVLVAAGGGMMSQAFPGTISRQAAVVAPGLMVMAIILFMGKVSGAHLNPAVSVAFALRRDFPWWRVPGYIVVQLGGAVLACWFLQAVVHVSATFGSNSPASGYSSVRRVLDGVHPDPRPGQRHPRNRLRRTEHRSLRCASVSAATPRARRIVGKSDLRCAR